MSPEQQPGRPRQRPGEEPGAPRRPAGDEPGPWRQRPGEEPGAPRQRPGEEPDARRQEWLWRWFLHRDLGRPAPGWLVVAAVLGVLATVVVYWLRGR